MQHAELDQTTVIPLNSDMLSEGETQRRVREETALYRRQVEMLDAEYERRHNGLNAIFCRRIMEIAANPFATLQNDGLEPAGHAEVPQ